MERDEDGGRVDTMLVRNLLDNLVRQQWRVVRSERRVRRHNNALLPAELNDVLLVASTIEDPPRKSAERELF